MKFIVICLYLQKLKLLSQIAAITFEQDYFFAQSKVQWQYIRNYYLL